MEAIAYVQQLNLEFSQVRREHSSFSAVICSKSAARVGIQCSTTPDVIQVLIVHPDEGPHVLFTTPVRATYCAKANDNDNLHLVELLFKAAGIYLYTLDDDASMSSVYAEHPTRSKGVTSWYHDGGTGSLNLKCRYSEPASPMLLQHRI